MRAVVVILAGAIVSSCSALTLPDSKVTRDASVVSDAGSSPDASVALDASVSPDPLVPDAGAQTDAGSPRFDAGTPPTDAWRLDAGVTSLALGQNHGCALLDDGTVLCWGAGMPSSDGGTRAHVRHRNAQALSASYNATFAVTAAQHLEAWGTNFYAELGDGTTVPSVTPVHTALAGTPHSVVGGAYHACARTTAGGVECWGLNGSGQAGAPAAQGTVRVPLAIANVTDAVELACGTSSSFARIADGGVMAWGYDQIFEQSEHARPFAIFGPARQISAAWFHGCAALLSGQAQCWGRAFEGELGFDAGSTFLLNGLVPNLHDVVNVCAGFKYSCAVQRDGGTHCWGDNTWGQLGTGNYAPAPSPRQVDLPAAKSVVCSERVTCATTVSDGLYCWGDNSNGQFGWPTPPSATQPVHVPLP